MPMLTGCARRGVQTVEDLKARYYGIQRELLRQRSKGDPDLKRNPLFVHDFDAEYERFAFARIGFVYP